MTVRCQVGGKKGRWFKRGRKGNIKSERGSLKQGQSTTKDEAQAKVPHNPNKQSVPNAQTTVSTLT